MNTLRAHAPLALNTHLTSTRRDMPLRYEYEDWLTGERTGGVAATAFSPNGRFIATAGLNGLVSIWTLPDLKPYHTFTGNSPAVSLEWIPNATAKLLFGTMDGMICLLELSPVRDQLIRGNYKG